MACAEDATLNERCGWFDVAIATKFLWLRTSLITRDRTGLKRCSEVPRRPKGWRPRRVRPPAVADPFATIDPKVYTTPSYNR